MDDLLKNLASESEKAFSSKIDFSDKGSLAKASYKIFEYLDKFRIGPKVLTLLIVFGFSENMMEKIWQGINEVIRKNR